MTFILESQHSNAYRASWAAVVRFAGIWIGHRTATVAATTKSRQMCLPQILPPLLKTPGSAIAEWLARPLTSPCADTRERFKSSIHCEASLHILVTQFAQIVKQVVGPQSVSRTAILGVYTFRLSHIVFGFRKINRVAVIETPLGGNNFNLKPGPDFWLVVY